MVKFKKAIGIIILLNLMIILFFSGCAQNEAEEDKLVFGYSTPSLQNSFWISVSSAMQESADEHGVELYLRDGASNTAKQAADIEDLIEQDVDVMLITPYDSLSLTPSIKEVNKAGIPLIIVDIGVKDPEIEYDCFIVTDNYRGGKLAAAWLAGYIKENEIQDPLVATIEAQLGAENARERHRGFVEVMGRNGIPVIEGYPADSLKDKAMIIMEDLLQTHPDITAVFGECDDMALGALQAIRQAQADTIVVGYDGNFAACEEIKKGSNLMADIDQRPEEMGRLAIEIGLKILNGEKFNKEIKINPVLIVRDNVDEFLNK